MYTPRHTGNYGSGETEQSQTNALKRAAALTIEDLPTLALDFVGKRKEKKKCHAFFNIERRAKRRDENLVSPHYSGARPHSAHAWKIELSR